MSTVLAITIIGMLMITTASPTVANRIHLQEYYFIRYSVIYLSLSFVVMLCVSFLSVNILENLSIIGFTICIFLIFFILFAGIEIKGARRWLYIGTISIQPSEFIKPFFVVLNAYLLTKDKLSIYLSFKKFTISKYLSSFLIYLVTISLLVLQPDFGMAALITIIWIIQWFIIGLSVVLWILITILTFTGIVVAYFTIPHVHYRIDHFLHLHNAKNSFQVSKSLQAFKHGGLFGTGPGEGTVKLSLPDAHTDFIFAVAGEEFGIIFCCLIAFLFLFISLRGLFYVLKQQHDNMFLLLTVIGLVMLFYTQAFINIAVTINLMPTKGMTLPLISYGGSSNIAVAIELGIILAITRVRFILSR